MEIKHFDRGDPINNFSKIGYKINNMDDIFALMSKAEKSGETYNIPEPLGGKYIVNKDKLGIETWGIGTKENIFSTVIPFFRSQNKNNVHLEKRVGDPQYPHEGGYIARSNNGSLRFVFDCPDIALHESIKIQSDATISLTAFPDQFNLLTQDQYDKNPRTKSGLKIAVKSFIPSGLFIENQIQSKPNTPSPYASFSGVVNDYKQIINPVTLHPFYNLKVSTHALDIDIVADTRSFPRMPKPQDIFQCYAWIIGNIVDFDYSPFTQ